MGKKAVMVSIEELIHKQAKDKGINVSQEAENALKRKIGEQVPKEIIKLECYACKAIVDKGYWCPESNRAWCINCHNELDITKSCREWHKEEMIDGIRQGVHFHNPLGNVPLGNYGKSIKDLEKGNTEHTFNSQGVGVSNASGVIGSVSSLSEPADISLHHPDVHNEERQSVERLLYELTGIKPSDIEVDDYLKLYKNNNLNIFSYAETLRNKHGVNTYTHATS